MRGPQWRRYARSIVFALALPLLGCGGDDVPNLVGTWTGTIQNSVAGTGTLLLSISQSNIQLSGTWQTTYPDPNNNNGGTLSGTVDEPAIALVLTTTKSRACSFTVAANLEDDHHFTGTYASFNCATTEAGTLDVTRP